MTQFTAEVISAAPAKYEIQKACPVKIGKTARELCSSREIGTRNICRTSPAHHRPRIFSAHLQLLKRLRPI